LDTPAVTDSDVSSDLGEGFGSPSQLLYPAVIPDPTLPSLTTPNRESFTDNPQLSPATSSTTGSSPGIFRDDAQLDHPLQATRQGSYSSSSKVCELCQELFSDSEQLVVHLTDIHPDMPNTCGRPLCRKPKDKRTLLRHLQTSKDHRNSDTPVFRCRCGITYSRKDKFRNHFVRFACSGNHPLACPCGMLMADNRIQEFHTHFEACGRGAKGRPRKERSGIAQERTISEGVLAQE